jgi:hypothetical protein
MSHDDTLRAALELTVEPPVLKRLELAAIANNQTLRGYVGDIFRDWWTTITLLDLAERKEP